MSAGQPAPQGGAFLDEEHAQHRLSESSTEFGDTAVRFNNDLGELDFVNERGELLRFIRDEST